MPATHTELRIKKLAAKGLTPEQIAKKIGRPGDTERVLKTLNRGKKESSDAKNK